LRRYAHGQNFAAYHKDRIELYCEKRFFTFTGDDVIDGPLVDLTDTGLRKFLKATTDDNSEQYTNGRDHIAADLKLADTGSATNPLEAYIDAGEIPAGECDNVLTQFWGHAVRAVKLGHATIEQAALFMGRVNVRLAENKDKEFHWKFQRLLEKEGLPIPINLGKYAGFDDGNAIQLLGPKPAELPPLAFQSDFSIEDARIPERDWILKGWLLRKHLTMLVAPPGDRQESNQLAAGHSDGDRQAMGRI
jgi:hypothetical protein